MVKICLLGFAQPTNNLLRINHFVSLFAGSGIARALSIDLLRILKSVGSAIPETRARSLTLAAILVLLLRVVALPGFALPSFVDIIARECQGLDRRLER